MFGLRLSTMSYERKYVAPASAAPCLLARLRAMLAADGETTHYFELDLPGPKAVAAN